VLAVFVSGKTDRKDALSVMWKNGNYRHGRYSRLKRAERQRKKLQLDKET
jgi:hypothetical protein